MSQAYGTPVTRLPVAPLGAPPVAPLGAPPVAPNVVPSVAMQLGRAAAIAYYGKTTPGRLVRALAVLVLLAVLAGALSVWAAMSIQNATRTIGMDAEPSVAIALRMAQSLSELDAAALGDALTDGGATTGTSLRFQAAMDQLGADIVDAAKNITYGTAEAEPLRDMQRGLSMYERAVVEARYIGAGNAWMTLHRLQWASRVNREFALPGAIALSRVNEKELEDAYSGYRATSLLLGALAFAAFVLLVVALLAVQAWLARRTRRTLNLPLAGATVVAALAGLWFGYTVLTERADLRAAKEDAYDSLLVLFAAKGEVASLRGAVSLWLLDDAAQPEANARVGSALRNLITGVDLTQPDQVRQFRERLGEALRAEQAGNDKQALRIVSNFGGYLGKELGNITFGFAERQAATDSVTTLMHVVDVIRATQATDVRNRVLVVADWLRESGTGGAAAFLATQAALDRTIAVNQTEFDRRDRSARRTAALLPYGVLGALALTAGLAAGGLWQRLREYR